MPQVYLLLMAVLAPSSMVSKMASMVFTASGAGMSFKIIFVAIPRVPLPEPKEIKPAVFRRLMAEPFF